MTSVPTPLSSTLSIDLRLRFLETLLQPTASSSSSPSISRRVALLNSILTQSLESNQGTDAIRRFVATYDLNEPLLSVPPVPSTPTSSAADLTPAAKVSLILEAENEIKALERELREIEALEQRGVVGAGKLEEHEALKADLVDLGRDLQPVKASYASLESRINALLTRYNDYISTLSEIFVSWNDIVSAAEDAVTKLEKERNKELDFA